MIDHITVRGARQHNLQDLHLEIPRNKLTVVTGLSGSGKSSLAFDTIYAEGQRRYVETLSPYARQFLDQMERPDVDSIDGLSPALSIEQKTTSRSPRSTVGTITEIYDYLRLLYSSIGTAHCPRCGTPITRQSVEQIVTRVMRDQPGRRVMILAPIVRGRKGIYRKEMDDLAQLGFVKARIDGKLLNLEDDVRLDRQKAHTIEAVVDVVRIRAGIEKRLANSVRTATRLARGIVLVADPEGEESLYSEKLACLECGASVPELEPRSFSFNSRYGACPECAGLGSRWRFDPSKVVADPSKPLLEGAVAPALLSLFVEGPLKRVAKRLRIPLTKRFDRLTGRQQDLLLYGERSGKAARAPFPGLLALLDEWCAEVVTRAGDRDWWSRYLSPSPCPACQGKRLRPESLAVNVAGMSIADFTELPLRRALEVGEGLELDERQRQVAGRLLQEICNRLRFLINVGLEYLTLNRSAATLSGGEAQRVRLATQIGTQLRGVLYVLDEPSIGLHSRDHGRLLDTLGRLRDLGNTVLVVEHDQETMERADHLVDLGPGAGRLGGRLVAQGNVADVAQVGESLTGQYLSGRREVPLPPLRRQSNGAWLTVRGARHHNLKSIDVPFPLGTFIVVTGVSGSGKSTLVNEILYPVLARHVYRSHVHPGGHDKVEGLKHVDKVVRIDQSPIGRTPRSNPATYTGVFSPIRQLFSQLPESRARGYRPGRFSFNVKGGRCEACQGDGNRRIEMSFLPDVYVTCEVCRGRRYNQETLQVKFKHCSIADILEMTVEEVLPVMENLPQIQPKLQTLMDVGLGYLHLGQSSTTLSGGEAQRIKLARELSKRQTGRTVYILDEPTTGLHFEDVRKLLEVLDRLVSHGNTVIVIEHNLEVIKCADWIVDLGPEGGEDGGRVVATGPPEEVVLAPGSHTGAALRRVLERRVSAEVPS